MGRACDSAPRFAEEKRPELLSVRLSAEMQTGHARRCPTRAPLQGVTAGIGKDGSAKRW